MEKETREALESARIVTKAAARTIRTLLQVITELQNRLEAEDAWPLEEAERNGDSHGNTEVKVRIR